MKLKTCAVVYVSFLVLASQLSAFDGQRKGFVLGGGGGFGYLAVADFAHNRGISPSLNFKLGYGVSNTLEISCNIVAAGVFRTGIDGDDVPSGLAAIALTKYFKPEGPGFFVTGGIGLSKIDTAGFGAIGGVGYELSRHWSVQGDLVYMHTNVYDAYDYLVVRLTFNVLAF